MKYLILFFSLNTFAQEIKYAYLPFEKISLAAANLKLTAELVLPAFTDKQKFSDYIRSDCRNFKENINRYQATDLNELLTMPLGYSMKKSYQVELSLKKENSIAVADNKNLKLAEPVSPELSISLVESSLTGLTHSLQLAGLTPKLTEMSDHYEIKFNSRDQFCDFIENKLIIKVKLNVALQNLENSQLKADLQTFADASHELLLLEKSDRVKAVKLGFLMQDFFEIKQKELANEFRSYDYFWNLLFTDETKFAKTSLWSTSGSLNLSHFFTQVPQDITVGVAL